MADIIKYIIEKLKSSPLGREVLIICVLIAVSFSVVQYFQDNTAKLVILKDYRLMGKCLLKGLSQIFA